jgi:hypothetical protein
MKKHNFNEAMSIFKGMVEGWSVVTETNERFELAGLDIAENHVMSRTKAFELDEISHLEQTLPMNGDYVLAWDESKEHKHTRIYIGQASNGLCFCENINGVIEAYKHVELMSPVRTLTIEQATEMLKGVLNEPFEIVN